MSSTSKARRALLRRAAVSRPTGRVRGRLRRRYVRNSFVGPPESCAREFRATPQPGGAGRQPTFVFRQRHRQAELSGTVATSQRQSSIAEMISACPAGDSSLWRSTTSMAESTARIQTTPGPSSLEDDPASADRHRSNDLNLRRSSFQNLLGR